MEGVWDGSRVGGAEGDEGGLKGSKGEEEGEEAGVEEEEAGKDGEEVAAEEEVGKDEEDDEKDLETGSDDGKSSNSDHISQEINELAAEKLLELSEVNVEAKPLEIGSPALLAQTPTDTTDASYSKFKQTIKTSHPPPTDPANPVQQKTSEEFWDSEKIKQKHDEQTLQADKVEKEQQLNKTQYKKELEAWTSKIVQFWPGKKVIFFPKIFRMKKKKKTQI